MLDLQFRASHPLLEEAFHSHTSYEIYLFHAGKVNYLIGDRIFALEPGDLIIMHGLTLHRAIVDKNEPYVRSIVHFDSRYVNRIDPVENEEHRTELLRPFRELRYARVRLDKVRQQEADSIFERMYEYERRGDYVGRQRMKLALLDLLYCIYDWFAEPLSASENHAEREKHVEDIFRVIEKRYAEDLTLDDIAREVHLNKHYVSKLFKDITGLTLFQYLNHRRVNQAKVLFVSDPHLPITDVSLEVGYKHLPHFSRIFKQTVGCSPDEYRKKYR
ncbi:AraC family transcriptional regulator [Paenibacillus marinisediminis]